MGGLEIRRMLLLPVSPIADKPCPTDTISILLCGMNSVVP